MEPREARHRKQRADQSATTTGVCVICPVNTVLRTATHSSFGFASRFAPANCPGVPGPRPGQLCALAGRVNRADAATPSTRSVFAGLEEEEKGCQLLTVSGPTFPCSPSAESSLHLAPLQEGPGYGSSGCTSGNLRTWAHRELKRESELNRTWGGHLGIGHCAHLSVGWVFRCCAAEAWRCEQPRPEPLDQPDRDAATAHWVARSAKGAPSVRHLRVFGLNASGQARRPEPRLSIGQAPLPPPRDPLSAPFPAGFAKSPGCPGQGKNPQRKATNKAVPHPGKRHTAGCYGPAVAEPRRLRRRPPTSRALTPAPASTRRARAQPTGVCRQHDTLLSSLSTRSFSSDAGFGCECMAGRIKLKGPSVVNVSICKWP
ncbi:uncharacterized protein LOC115071698 [Nannospalax galili]|uniref:uncharacterized protein LOC115071698 n=1 Tax=Nannospalax galili TaxID=1026970 RepID=UPI00111BF821|nr:uncharacterized protein LOC115071698 [Nannospalax galili]